MVANMMRLGRMTLFGLYAFTGISWSQVMNDPTRPPAEIGDGSAILAHSSSAASSKGLLSVLMSPTRCSAIIDGKSIKLGENYGNSRLVEITSSGVVLQGARGQHKMELFPRVVVKVTFAQPSMQQPVSCKLEDQRNQKQLPRPSGMKERK